MNVFTQHSRNWRTNLYVYPVISRRSGGLSIGININPDKVCNFDCVYCCVDRTTPPLTRTVDLERLDSELDELLTLARSGAIFDLPPLDQTPPNLRHLSDVAFSGDGEPTASPHFLSACDRVVERVKMHDNKARNDLTKIVLITNATLLHRRDLIDALCMLDRNNGEIWAKLDAGTEEYYRQVNRTTVPLSRILRNIAATGRRRPIVIQSMFVELAGRHPALREINAYIDHLRQLREDGCQMKLVQVYTVARLPSGRNVRPARIGSLNEIASRVMELGLRAEVYEGTEDSFDPVSATAES
jgi:wyosine [tRNA(Phe)-imidazoG37] synthetase (radical SAM superfamily)